MDIQKSPAKAGFRKMYVAALAALSFGVSMGMACGYSASATADMGHADSPLHPNVDQVAWIGSILALGALAGGLLAGYLSSRFGRKGTLIFSSIPFITGWLLIAYAKNFLFIYAGRFITGICVGITCVTTPPYLIEISTPEVRGLLGASFQLFIVIGVLVINGLGAVLHWQWLAIPAAAFVILGVIGLCFVPESPRWLVEKGVYQEAIASVKFLQGDYLDASAECVAIDEDLRSQPSGPITMKDIRKPEVIVPALLAFSLVFFQQTSGSNAVLFYTVDIFKVAGSTLDPNIATIIVDAVLVVATAISTSLMDKAGRKPLLMASGLGMAVSLITLATYDLVSVSNSTFKLDYGWIPLASLIVYISAFSIGFGPIPWLMMAEMTPVRYRSVICGTATGICWLFTFIVTKTFQALELSIHDYGTYYLYAAFSLLSCVFTFFFLPETKGKNLEDIQQYFMSHYTRKGKCILKEEEMS